tara:strand:+ start:18305 stop:18499 length:195 start_codon:yes stop_codon:yes gene_type:complete
MLIIQVGAFRKIPLGQGIKTLVREKFFHVNYRRQYPGIAVRRKKIKYYRYENGAVILVTCFSLP